MTDISFNKSDKPFKIFAHEILYNKNLFNNNYDIPNFDNTLKIMNNTGNIILDTPINNKVIINNLEVSNINLSSVATSVSDISFDNISINKSLSIGNDKILTIENNIAEFTNLNIGNSLDVSGEIITNTLYIKEKIQGNNNGINFEDNVVFTDDVKFEKQVIFDINKNTGKSINFDENKINFLKSEIDFSNCVFKNINTGNFNINEISNNLSDGNIFNTRIGYNQNNKIDVSNSAFNNISLISKQNNNSYVKQSSSVIITSPDDIDNKNKVLMINNLQSYYDNTNGFNNLDDISLRDKFVIQCKNDQITIKTPDILDICYNLNNEFTIEFKDKLTDNQIYSLIENNIDVSYNNLEKKTFIFYNYFNINKIINIFNDKWIPDNLPLVKEFSINYIDNSGNNILYNTNNSNHTNKIQIVKVYNTKWSDNTIDTLYINSNNESYNQSYSITMPRNRCKKGNILKISDIEKYNDSKIYSDIDKIVIDSKDDNVVIVLPKILPNTLDWLIYPNNIIGTGLFIIEFDTSLNMSQYNSITNRSLNGVMIKEYKNNSNLIEDISKTFICGDISTPPFLFDYNNNTYQNNSNKFLLFQHTITNLPCVNKFSIFFRKIEDGLKPTFIESDNINTGDYIKIIRNYTTEWVDI